MYSLRHRFNLKLLGWGAAALLVLIFACGFIFPRALNAGNDRVITIYYDDIEQTVVTDAATIEEVLQRAKIKLDPLDAVEPARDTKLEAPAYNINIYRARPVTVVDGTQSYTVVTPHSSALKITEAAKLHLYDEDTTNLTRINDFINENGVGLKLTIDRAIPFTLVLYGKQQDVRTQKATIGEFMQEKGIVLGEQDGASLAANTPISAGLKLDIWRNGVQTMTNEEEVAFTVEIIRDTDRPAGYKAIKEPGKKGKKLVTYEVELKNGVEIKRKQIQSVTTEQPTKQVEVVGGKNYTTNEQIIYDLRMCESGGNYQRNSNNGFYGAYQFMISTWDRVAKKIRPELAGIRPDLAAPADQDYMVIENARMSSGGFATQHPGCYKKLGLPVKPF